MRVAWLTFSPIISVALSLPRAAYLSGILCGYPKFSGMSIFVHMSALIKNTHMAMEKCNGGVGGEAQQQIQNRAARIVKRGGKCSQYYTLNITNKFHIYFRSQVKFTDREGTLKSYHMSVCLSLLSIPA